MTDPTSPQAIAARLTDRQKKALLWLRGDGAGTPLWQSGKLAPAIRGLCFRKTKMASYKHEYKLGMGYVLVYFLTDLGRLVREELTKTTT